MNTDFARIGFTSNDRAELADRVISNARLVELLHTSVDRICELEMKLQETESKLETIAKLFKTLSELAHD